MLNKLSYAQTEKCEINFPIFRLKPKLSLPFLSGHQSEYLPYDVLLPRRPTNGLGPEDGFGLARVKSSRE